MSDDMKLTEAAIVDTVEKAKAQSAELIEKLLREAIGDFEDSGSDGFKLTLTIEGERKGRYATLTLQTKGQTAVELKRKDSSAAQVVDWGPTLFDGLEEDGADAGDVPDEDGGDAPAPLLLRAAPKLLPAPGDEQDGGPETLDVAEAEIVEEAGEETARKVQTIRISNTGISDWSLKKNPEWYRELKTTRKTGAAELGEVVRIIIRNPDDGHKFDMGLYTCTDAAPAYDDPADGRSLYTFTKLEDEDGPVNGGGDLGDEED